jgi:DNA-binding GntR family transcriptional regulator
VTPERLARLTGAETKRLLSDHTGIAEAIAARDADAAEARMRLHLRGFLQVAPL